MNQTGHRRHDISDTAWAVLEPHLPGRAKNNRQFMKAIVWILRTGAPWRDLPERFGNWNSAWRRFNRWAQKGVWQRVFRELQDPDMEWMFLDSTVIRAHSDAAGQKGGKKRKLLAVRAADLAPKSTLQSMGWATRSSFD